MGRAGTWGRRRRRSFPRKKKRAYQAAPLQQIRVVELLPLVMAGCTVALDIAKQKLVVAVATLAGEMVKLFRFDHPTETREFLRVVEALCVGVEGRNVTAVMEPTGTYGDALRHQLTCAGVPPRERRDGFDALRC